MLSSVTANKMHTRWLTKEKNWHCVTLDSVQKYHMTKVCVARDVALFCEVLPQCRNMLIKTVKTTILCKCPFHVQLHGSVWLSRLARDQRTTIVLFIVKLPLDWNDTCKAPLHSYDLCMPPPQHTMTYFLHL